MRPHDRAECWSRNVMNAPGHRADVPEEAAPLRTWISLHPFRRWHSGQQRLEQVVAPNELMPEIDEVNSGQQLCHWRNVRKCRVLVPHQCQVGTELPGRFGRYP